MRLRFLQHKTTAKKPERRKKNKRAIPTEQLANNNKRKKITVRDPEGELEEWADDEAEKGRNDDRRGRKGVELGRARLEHRRPRSENRSWAGLREGTTGAAKNGREMNETES